MRGLGAAIVWAVMAAACTKGEPEMIRDQAAEKMKCAPDGVTVVAQRAPDGETRVYRATGCGEEAVYRCESTMDQVASQNRMTGSYVRSETHCEALGKKD